MCSRHQKVSFEGHLTEVREQVRLWNHLLMPLSGFWGSQRQNKIRFITSAQTALCCDSCLHIFPSLWVSRDSFLPVIYWLLSENQANISSMFQSFLIFPSPTVFFVTPVYKGQSWRSHSSSHHICPCCIPQRPLILVLPPLQRLPQLTRSSPSVSDNIPITVHFTLPAPPAMPSP